jgi:hypothetical protein
MTRASGFHVEKGVTGREFRYGDAQSIRIEKGDALVVEFSIPACDVGVWIGFGGWYKAPESVECSIEGPDAPAKRTLSPPADPNWSKFGSMWQGDGKPKQITVRFSAHRAAIVSLWDCVCGVIEHERLEDARAELLLNMYQYSPEAHFFVVIGVTATTRASKGIAEAEPPQQIVLKSCNRCARFLPINTNNEQKHLSFSNHCKAPHLRPCRHVTFSHLKNVNDGTELILEYGFQLECRFCKKFEVNAAHNPQRTAAQMKEDGARRRAIEFLLTQLLGESRQLSFRQETGRELADTIWERFDKKCFNCGCTLATPGDMCLDHTRPLALLWPLDETATCLCKGCNSAKRDRAPVAFYGPDQLLALAELTGLPLDELSDPHPNLAVVQLLKERLDWFFDEFLNQPELLKELDGKTADELLVKALAKVIGRCPEDYRFDIQGLYHTHRRKRG